MHEIEKEIEKETLEDAIAYLLSRVWGRTKWKKMRGRDPLDVFQHRLNVACRQETVSKMLTKLCHGLHLQGVDTDPKLIRNLDRISDRVLTMIRDQNQFFVLKAREFSYDYPVNSRVAFPKSVEKFMEVTL